MSQCITVAIIQVSSPLVLLQHPESSTESLQSCYTCVVFTEMLGMDSMTLRVDIQAASRLLAHGGSHEDLFGDNAMRENSMADAIGIYLTKH